MALLLVSMAFYCVPVRAATIKIGVMGPMDWIQGQGMAEGAALAAQKINTAGGILGNTVEIVTADTLRGKTDPDAETGYAAAMELMAAGVDFVIGGFRTEAVMAARGVFADYEKIFFVAGASTDEIIDDGPVKDNAWDDVREDYDRYRYTFRITPINSTMLFYSIAGFLKFAMLTKLLPIYGPPLKIAVISEALLWADTMHAYLSSDLFWNYVMGMGGAVDVVEAACSRVSPIATDLSAELQKVKDYDARLLIHVLSGPVGRAFITQWHDMGVKAIPVGIDVPGQEIPAHWTGTSGKCEYEGFLVTSGQRTPITPGTVEFYDITYSTYSHAPIYTSYGAYDGIIALDEIIEAEGRWPMTSNEMVPLIEKHARSSLTGNFKYTGPHPMGTAAYDTYMFNGTHSYLDINPTMAGTLHDVFMTPYELGPTWPTGYTRALIGQWQAGRLEIVYPVDRPYSKMWAIPPLMYPPPYTTDVNQDGKRTITDIAIVSYAIGSRPGNARWQFLADVDIENDLHESHWHIDGYDFTPVAFDYGKPVVPLPPPI